MIQFCRYLTAPLTMLLLQEVEAVSAAHSQIVAIQNEQICTIDSETKAADGGLEVPVESFFASLLPEGATLTDLHIRYDEQEDCWFISAMSTTRIGNLVDLLLAVSEEGMITKDTHWSFFSFRHHYNHPSMLTHLN